MAGAWHMVDLLHALLLLSYDLVRGIPPDMVKTYESRFPPSPNLDKVTVSFDKLNNSYFFFKKVYMVHTLIKGTHNMYWSYRL